MIQLHRLNNITFNEIALINIDIIDIFDIVIINVVEIIWPRVLIVYRGLVASEIK